MNNQNETMEIDLLELLGAVINRIWFVIFAVIIGTLSAFLYAKFLVTPLYQAKAMMYVNNSSISVGSASVSISSGDITAAKSLVETYIVIMESRKTLNSVIEEAELLYTYDQLKNMISASAVNSTEIFQITITSADPKEAELIANTIADVLPEKISDVVEGSSVKIVDYAVVPASPVSPSITKYSVIGFLIGAVISVGIIVILELFSETIHSESFLLQTYDIPVLSVIPSMQDSNKKSAYYSYENKSNKTKREKS